MVCNYSQRHPSDFMRLPSYSNIHPAGCLEGRGEKKKGLFLLWLHVCPSCATPLVCPEPHKNARSGENS